MRRSLRTGFLALAATVALSIVPAAPTLADGDVGGQDPPESEDPPAALSGGTVSDTLVEVVLLASQLALL